jgi:holo-[acyl-carrier protein] synthase
MLIKGFGVDIIEIERVEKAIERRKKFIERIFTEKEAKYCSRRPKPAAHFALRFAAKEAVAKALGTGIGLISWRDIEVVNEKKGKPKVILKGRAKEIAAKEGVEEIFISLSYTRGNAIASAIALGSSGLKEEKSAKINLW